MKTYTYDAALKASTEYFGNDLSARAFVDKYALRNENNELLELTPDDMHKRIAKELARIEKNKFKKPLSEDEIFEHLRRFKSIIPQGSPMYGIGNKYQYISLSNCYVIETTDSIGGIFKADQEMAQIFKRRGGNGLDISNLRPVNAPTKNSSRSSTGTPSWMERYSNTTREIGQAGRRAASMITLSVHHPDILHFITIKNDDTKVTGANISVRLTDEFLNALKNNKDYELRFPVDSNTPEYSEMISAQKVWDTIVNSAWQRAEPGLLFWDNIIRESPADCYSDFRSTSTNPCCFSKKEPVSVITQKGLKNITDITSNDLIWIDSKKTWRKTSGFFDVGIQNVYKVTFENNTTLFITDNHKLAKTIPYRDGTEIYYDKYKLTELKKLSVGDKILIQQDCHSKSTNYTTIKSIGCIGKEECGCIEVEEFHELTANGIISGQSEIPLCPYDSCRLLAINLFHAVKNPFTDNAEFDFDLLAQTTKTAQRLMDDIVDLEIEAINRIIKKVESDPEPEDTKAIELNLWNKIKDKAIGGRRTGTGITALGDVLAALNIPYGSKKSVVITEQIYECLKFAAYESSIDMAEELGPFPVWDTNKEKNNPFLLRIQETKPDLYDRMLRVGRRNIAILTTAPTGTVSMMASLFANINGKEVIKHGTTSGIEPIFCTNPYTRRKKGNPGDNDFRSDFVDQNGDHWMEFKIYHPGIELWREISGIQDINKSPYVSADNIDWINRVKLQSAANHHVDHAISSTINVPNDISKEQVAEIYLEAWKNKLKGITVYRDGCRTGVLVKDIKNCISKTTAPKRPNELDCDVNHISVKGQSYFVLVGLLNGEPYEIFAGKNGVIDKKVKKGKIIKQKRSRYKAEFEDGTELSPIGAFTSDEEDTLTRLISAGLRHGTDVSFLVHQLEKAKGDLQSFSKSLLRALKKYVPDGLEIKGEECPECSNKLIRTEGCSQCQSCGWSKC